MDKKSICEAMYALPSGVVVRRKRTIGMPLLILAIGIGVVAINYGMDIEAQSADFSSSLLLIAGATIIVGLLLLLSRLFDREGYPWHTPTRRPLRYEERFYPVEQRNEVQRMVDEAAYLRLVAADTKRTSGIAVAIYRSEDKRFAAMQAYEYIDYEYRPITGIRTMERNE